MSRRGTESRCHANAVNLSVMSLHIDREERGQAPAIDKTGDRKFYAEATDDE